VESPCAAPHPAGDRRLQRGAPRTDGEGRRPSGTAAMLPELRRVVDVRSFRTSERADPRSKGWRSARRLSKAPERYIARTAAAAAIRELCGRGVDLRPGSKIRYLLATGAGARSVSRRTETPDVARYEEMLREAADELVEHILRRKRRG